MVSGWSKRASRALALGGALLLVRAASAAPRPAPSAAPTPSAEIEAEEPEAPDSPRASLSRYFELTRAGRYAEATRYLDVSRPDEARAPELAARLRAVLDRYSWVDLDAVSPAPLGNLADGLPASYEQVGSVPGKDGREQPVLLVRRAGKDVRWVFSRATVQHIDDWYGRLGDRWILEHLPPALLRAGPRELTYFQWIALPVLLLLSLVLGAGMGSVTRRVLRHVAERTPNPWDDVILQRSRGPLALAFAVLVAHLATPLLALYEPGEKFVGQLLRAVLFFDFFWALGRIVDVGGRALIGSPWTQKRPASRALLSLVGRAGRIAVAAIAVVAFLSELGYHVETLIAGLGLGGLAVALAAQKTVENLFGAFSIGADQPFREGDFVKVDDLMGTVEGIGLRSTRIRTLDRSLVSVPNGKLAEMRLESLSARDRIRFFCVLRLVHGTTVDQLERVLSECERLVREHRLVHPDGILVSFSEIGEYSLNVEVGCWFATTDWAEFLRARQEVLLEFLHVVARAKTAFMRPPLPVLPSYGEPMDTALAPSAAGSRR